jgi:hypothetical protein
MKKRSAVRLSCEIDRSLSPRLIEILTALGVARVEVQTARTIHLRGGSRLFGLVPSVLLEDDPAEIYRFLVEPGSETAAADAIAEGCGLPARGSVYVCDCELLEGEAGEALPAPSPAATRPHPFLTGLSRIVCIVQRGQGTEIARAALDLGFSVPAVTFGEGTGLRDKLGLLRITIPAAKEVLTLVVASTEADEVLDRLVAVGRLDEPGKGFIYKHELSRGLVNTRIFRGRQRAAASMEQIIEAIDGLIGSAEWRTRAADEGRGGGGRRCLEDLCQLTIVCNEGAAGDLVGAAMAAGAAGATVCKCRSLPLTEGGADSGISPARESADLIVGPVQVPGIAEALDAAGIFSPDMAGRMEVMPVPRACTYLGVRRGGGGS